jgi:hypothetical protein
MAEKLKAIVFDGLTGQTTERELNSEELAHRDEVAAIEQSRQDAEQTKDAARQSALAKLAALGLTEEEIAAL